jgi:D-serine deaminase-like pyridoxal phosphate-dependent protein
LRGQGGSKSPRPVVGGRILRNFRPVSEARALPSGRCLALFPERWLAPFEGERRLSEGQGLCATLGRVNLASLRTPSVLVDQQRLDRNIERMQSAADTRRVRLRPHAKTHKSVDIAQIQVAKGAVGICCAKLGEAEVFVDAGVEDIRLPYPLNPANSARVLSLLERSRLSFIVDHLDVAREWSRVLSDAGRKADVLVKVDVGFHRCGIDPEASDATDFVTRVADLPGLTLRGLLSHAGQAYGAASEAEIASVAADEARLLRTLRDKVRDAGVSLEEISVGATAKYSLHEDGITEVRPGNYVYYDRTQVALGVATWDDCALTVLARVVGRPAPDRLILDAGSKTLTTDVARGQGDVSGYGAILESLDGTTPNSNLLIERLSEEHATVRVRGDGANLQPGELVRIVPNHACVVSNLVDEVWLVSGNHALDRIDISARGRIQ